MLDLQTIQIFFALAIYSVIVFVFVWLENRHLRRNLEAKEQEMKHRMYELAILKDLGDRIGYSLNVQKIVDVITGSLRKLLEYSTVSYLIQSDEGRLIFHCILEESVNQDFINEVQLMMMKKLSELTKKNIDRSTLDESISGTITDESNRAKIKSFFNIPVVINDVTVGLLNVSSTKPGLYKDEEMNILHTIMNQASSAVSKLENILNSEKGRLNSMVESMAEGVLMVDTKNRLLVINPKARNLLNITKSQPTFFDVLAELSSKMDLRAKIDASLRSDKLETEQIELSDKILRILISPVKDGAKDPLGAVILFDDITSEKTVEKMRDDFTSMMVHELRSPLTGIRSIANLLKEEKIKNQKRKYQEFIDLIVSNSASMLDLVNDLLDVAKLEAGKFQILTRPTDVTNLIKNRIQSFHSLALENHLSIESQIEPLPLITLDENKIEQILNNFISNAIKFTKKGKVVVSAFVLTHGDNLEEKIKAMGLNWPNVNDLRFESNQLILAVTDSGAGIAEDQIPNLFNKFSQLEQASSEDKKGTGLGLVITKGIAEAHGGTVGVFSKPGEGSTFYCTIPIKS